MFVQDSLTNPALLKQIEARLDQFVQSDATAAGKDFAFRELSLIATDASLPVLTPMLTAAGDGRDGAVRALQDPRTGGRRSAAEQSGEGDWKHQGRHY